jgi:hypothetical protein
MSITLGAKQHKRSNSMEQTLSWEANSGSDSQEIPRLYGIRRFIYLVHKSPPLDPILSQMNSVHNFHHISVSHILKFSHLSLGLPSGLFLSGFPTKILYAFLISRTTRPSHSHWFNLPYNIWWRIHIMKLFIMQFSQAPPPLPPSWVQIFSSTPCTQTPSKSFLIWKFNTE